MAGRARLAPDLREEWQTRLRSAAGQMRHDRDKALESELELRATIVEAFEAGLSVTPIVQSTGLSLGRVYQVKRGTRR